MQSYFTMRNRLCQGGHIAAAAAIDLDWKEGADVLDPVFGILPPGCRQALCGMDLSHAEELRLRAGQRPAILQNGAERTFMLASGDGRVTQEDLQRTLMAACAQSQYAVQTQLCEGFVRLPGGYRLGVCGSAVMQDGQLCGIREVSSLALRIPHDIRHAPSGLLPYLTGSCLIAGAPGSGKTTLLRSCIRALSDAGARVAVADERMELAGCVGGVPQFDLGAHTDVLSGCGKGTAMMVLLRAMNPMWVAVDEITQAEDLRAIRQLAGCGVRLLATIHAASPDELRRRPQARTLLRAGIFERALFLRPDRTFYEERIPYAQNDRSDSDFCLVRCGGDLDGTRRPNAADAAARAH